MRRVILSIILGFLFPSICMMTIGFSSTFVPTGSLHNLLYGHSSPGILFAPFTLPIYFFDFIDERKLLPEVIAATLSPRERSKTE